MGASPWYETGVIGGTRMLAGLDRACMRSDGGLGIRLTQAMGHTSWCGPMDKYTLVACTLPASASGHLGLVSTLAQYFRSITISRLHQSTHGTRLIPPCLKEGLIRW